MTDNLPNLISSFVTAIDDEIAKIEEQGGNRFNLHGGQYLGGYRNAAYYYHFRTDSELNMPEDMPIEVQSGGVCVQGHLVRIEDYWITLALSAKIVVGTNPVIMITDTTFLLESLKTRLSIDLDSRNTKLAMELLNQNPRRTQKYGKPLQGLNTEQSHAIRTAVNCPITYIWGPPGTGKTETLAKLIARLLKSKMSVLLVAHSNVAVDTAMLRLIQGGAVSKSVSAGEIIRSGYPKLDEMKRLGSVLAPRVAEKRTPGITKRRQEKQAQLDEVIARLNDAKNGNGKAALMQRVNELRSELVTLRNTTKQEEINVTEQARMVGTTLTRAATAPQIYQRTYDAVIIDEASMAYVPHVFWASCLATQRVIISGDFRQLGSIVKADTENAKKWLGTDVFTHAGLVDQLENGKEDGRMVGLQVQYRMQPAISSLVGRIYSGRLRDDPSTKLDPDGVLAAEPYKYAGVTLIDTSLLPSGCYTPEFSYSRINTSSAECAVKLAKTAWGAGVRSIGIITPYAAQARYMHQLLSEQNLTQIRASTIHKFQGSESRLIILDLTDSFPQKNPGVLLSGLMGSPAMRLINVAITRAQSKLIVLADLRFLLDKLHPDSVVAAILKDMQERFYTYDALSGEMRSGPRKHGNTTNGNTVNKAATFVIDRTRKTSIRTGVMCEWCGNHMVIAVGDNLDQPCFRCQICNARRMISYEALTIYLLNNPVHCPACSGDLIPDERYRRQDLYCIRCNKTYAWLDAKNIIEVPFYR